MDDHGCAYEVRISDPGEVAAALPHLLGFRPEESVVLVGLGGASGGRVGLVVRADIPPRRHAAAVAAALARSVATDEPAGVLVVVVSEAADEAGPGDATAGRPQTTATADLPHRDVVHALVLPLAERGIPVRDALLVRRGRWWSYDCPYACCARDAGTPLPGGTSELAVASIATGQVVARDRAELVARIAPADGAAADAAAAAVLVVGRAHAQRLLDRGPAAVAAESWTAVTDAVTRCATGALPGRLTDVEVARVLWGLTDVGVRDRALGLAIGDDPAAAELLWTECTRRAPVLLGAAPATLLAVSAWVRGDGATANIALARALSVDPDYALAGLLSEALAACVPPDGIRQVITETLDRLDDPHPAG